jgi:hypothetical protein
LWVNWAKAVLLFIPTAALEYDNDGQIVIYTGLKKRATRDGFEVVPIDTDQPTR